MKTLELLSKELKANYAKAKKVEYKSSEFNSLISQELSIKQEIMLNYGKDALLEVLLGKTRTDGKFKSLNSKGNGYGN